MKYIRRWVYKRGHRPRYGSIFYSLHLDLIYTMKDAK